MTFSLCEEFGVHGRILVAGRTNLCPCYISLATDDVEEALSSLVGFEGLLVLVGLEVGVGDGEHWLSPF